jgi:hypothetical protein
VEGKKVYCLLTGPKKVWVVCRVARLFLVQHNKTGKMYQMTIKYIPNGHKKQHFPLKDPPKFTQIGTFGLKIYHLATLVV